MPDIGLCQCIFLICQRYALYMTNLLQSGSVAGMCQLVIQTFFSVSMLNFNKSSPCFDYCVTLGSDIISLKHVMNFVTSCFCNFAKLMKDEMEMPW